MEMKRVIGFALFWVAVGDYSRPGAAEYICGSVMYSTVRACGL